MLNVLRRVFSFSSWTVDHPMEPPPGNMLDASFDAQNQKIAELEALIADIRRSDGRIQNGVVSFDSLEPPLKNALGLKGPPVPGQLVAGGSESGEAEAWADTSRLWAEHMPDTIPGDSLAEMDITGDHWSSRWWANQAARIVGAGGGGGGGGGGFYIGESPPAEPILGLIWWNSSTGKTYIYYDDSSSLQWVQIAGDTSAASEGVGFLIPQMFGASGNGSLDDTAAFHACFAAAIGGSGVYIPPGTYKVGQLVIPANSVVRASKLAVIRSNGTVPGGFSNFVVDIGNNVDFDVLKVSLLGTEPCDSPVRIGDNVRGDFLSVVSDVQLDLHNGIRTRGQGVKIGRIEMRKIGRGVLFDNTASPTPTTNTDIGFIDVENYRRAIYLINCSARIGGVSAKIRTSTPGGEMDPGSNAILISGCVDLEIGDCWIEDPYEHSIRVGGTQAVGGPKTNNLRIGNVTAIRSLGCVIKLNPTTLASPGVTETVDNVQIGNVLAVDCGLGAPVGNSEILRFTHCRNVQVGDVLAVGQQYPVSGQYGLLINDSRNVHIASLGGPFNSGAVYIQGWWDTDEVSYFGGDVIGLRIDRLHGTCPGANAIAVHAQSEDLTKTFNVADVHIHFDGFSGWTTRLIWWLGGTLTGVFRMTGWLGGAVSPVYQTMPNTDNCQIDLTWNGKRLIGRAANIANAVAPEAALQMTTAGASLGEVRGRGLLLNAIEVTSALNAYGGAVEFTRVGSGRRGGGIAMKQTGTLQHNTGVAVWVSGGVAASDALLEQAIFKHTGDLNLPLIHTHADNAAAIAGGHVVGDIYKTATGELRIVI